MLDIQLRFHPDEKSFPCDKDKMEYDTFFPIYYNMRDYAYKGKKYKGVFYRVLYRYNYAIGLYDINPTSTNLGYHEDDKEYIAVLYDYDNNSPQYVYMSGHAQEGRWVKANECSVNEEGRLIIYAARYSHRHYHKPAILWRMFGFANDLTSDKGRHIDMYAIQDNSWRWNIQNKEVMDTTFRSFFLPLYVKFMNKMRDKQIADDDIINKGVVNE